MDKTEHVDYAKFTASHTKIHEEQIDAFNHRLTGHGYLYGDSPWSSREAAECTEAPPETKNGIDVIRITTHKSTAKRLFMERVQLPVRLPTFLNAVLLQNTFAQSH